ncbi:MAG TPA: polyhydroxyalkanoate synthesis regulator DNA-binding domain-containing protein [Deferrisomatales bacterium]|nr:polyhydroxyalkanoate synthesis regulator DNA-binding domain-containing protein [Deferrisomatales bacterium]
MSENRPGPVTIKKYANRRMYDTANSRYVNLAQIAAMIKEGVVVEVVDTATGEDLTKVILTQVILEEEKGQRNLLPVEFLHELIKYGESASGDFLRSFLSSGFDAYKQAQEQMTSTFKNWLPPGWPGSQPPQNPQAPRVDEDVLELKKRLADLEARLNAKAEREQ